MFDLFQSGKKKIKPDRKERNDSVYQLSRYVPYVKDIMEVCAVLCQISFVKADYGLP